ncbi:MAG TPA: class I SAM-dependent methyltransferase [Bryobacteraceae bacterium]|nr:class I SAM-dependent methyltransferase [Bryobacteraceae bacterium]
MSLPNPEPVLDLIEAFRHSKTMFVAVSMGIFDRLSQSRATAAQIASQLNTHPGATERLLDACAALGLLQKEDATYSNDPVAETYLCTASPHSLYGYIRYSDEALYPMWANLADAVREGSPRWLQTFGLDGPIFSSFFRSEKAMRDFALGMHGFGMLTSPKVAAAFDLSPFRRLVDLGGATGHLAIAACELYPQLRGTVFDLPQVTTLAREQVKQSKASARIDIVAGDFFEDELPPADLYALGRILHDWSDDKIQLLLRKVVATLPSGGALLIAEKLLNEDGVGPSQANMQSLNMLVVTEGRERTLSEYTSQLRAAGFAEVEGRRTGTALDAILAKKA